MCGDLEEGGPGKFETMLYNRYVDHAKKVLGEQTARNAPDDSLVAAIDQLFTAALGRAVKDTEATNENQRYDMLVMQPLVFARLAGFLAGHQSLAEDPMRKILEAMMHGYSEASQMLINDHGHDHHH